MGLFDREKKTSKEKITESEEDEFDEVVCPYCGNKIKSVEYKSLECIGDSVEVASCPKCNKILGILDY